MNRALIVVGRCVWVRGSSCCFRFKGVYRGERITQVIVNLWEKYDLMEGRDYILFLKFIRIEGTRLITSIVKYKDIGYPI